MSKNMTRFKRIVAQRFFIWAFLDDTEKLGIREWIHKNREKYASDKIYFAIKIYRETESYCSASVVYLA